MSTLMRHSALLLVIFCVSFLHGQQTQLHITAGSDSEHNPAWSEWNSSIEKMHVNMSSVKESDSADRDFVNLMLPHHQAALDMAKTELLYGQDPQMRRLAQEIITDQQSEIDLMQRWLQQHETVK
jgi:uncharacterized protein (DUF305 family)